MSLSAARRLFPADAVLSDYQPVPPWTPGNLMDLGINTIHNTIFLETNIVLLLFRLLVVLI